MDVFKWEDSADGLHSLLTPNKEVPEAAVTLAKGKWAFAGILPGLTPTDTRLALNSAKAVSDIEAHGFHESQAEVRITTVESSRSAPLP